MPKKKLSACEYIVQEDRRKKRERAKIKAARIKAGGSTAMVPLLGGQGQPSSAPQYTMPML